MSRTPLAGGALTLVAAAPIEAREWRGWNIHPPQYPVSTGIEFFASEVAERSNGALTALRRAATVAALSLAGAFGTLPAAAIAPDALLGEWSCVATNAITNKEIASCRSVRFVDGDLVVAVGCTEPEDQIRYVVDGGNIVERREVGARSFADPAVVEDRTPDTLHLSARLRIVNGEDQRVETVMTRTDDAWTSVSTLVHPGLRVEGVTTRVIAERRCTPREEP